MSTHYYTETDQYPPIVKLLLQRVLIFITSTLYPEEFKEDPEKAYRRAVISHIGAGNEFNITQAIQSFQTFSAIMPFTAYGIDAFDDGEIKNWAMHSGTKYFSDTGRKGGAVHQVLTLPMVSFFNRADDFWMAISRLKHATATLTRLEVPLKINKVIEENRPGSDYAVDTHFTIDISLEMSKGEFAFDFQKYLTENRIFDLSHTVKVRYYDFAFSEYIANQTVLDMCLNLNEMLADGSSRLIYSMPVPDAPLVTSTSPANLTTGVSPAIPIIQITFNNSMKEGQVEPLISFSPAISADWGWSSDSKTLTFYLYDPLAASTLYTVVIPDTVQDVYNNNPEADYEFKFTTA